LTKQSFGARKRKRSARRISGHRGATVADEKEPLERMAGAVEKIADELSSIRYSIETRTETLQMSGTGVSESPDDLAAWIRGEKTPEAEADAERTEKELQGLGTFSIWLRATAGRARQQAEKNPEESFQLAKAEAFEEALEMLRKARPS
jgi:hypothetical protein